MWKWELVAENARLKEEVAYLKGRVEVLEGEGVRAVGHVRDIMVSFSAPGIVDGYGDTGEIDVEMEGEEGDGSDWTDQLAPRQATADFLESLERDWNDAPHIGDPGEGAT